MIISYIRKHFRMRVYRVDDGYIGISKAMMDDDMYHWALVYTSFKELVVVNEQPIVFF